MTFKDFNDEGPGTFGWDYVLGGNTTGLFPDESHYEVDGNTLIEVTLTHTGGGTYEPVYGDSWTISNISSVQNGSFTFEQDGRTYRATINNQFRSSSNCCIVDLVELLKKKANDEKETKLIWK